MATNFSSGNFNLILVGLNTTFWIAFSWNQHPNRIWGPQYLLCNGYKGLSPAVKRRGREADNSLPSTAEVQKGGAIPSLPHMSSWHSA
jgi:hypothetical protein